MDKRAEDEAIVEGTQPNRRMLYIGADCGHHLWGGDPHGLGRWWHGWGWGVEQQAAAATRGARAVEQHAQVTVPLHIHICGRQWGYFPGVGDLSTKRKFCVNSALLKWHAEFAGCRFVHPCLEIG